MEPSGFVFLKVLLNKYALGGNEALIKTVPTLNPTDVLKFTTSSQDIGAAVQWRHRLFDRVHYSWLAPVIKTLAPPLQTIIGNALPEPQGSKLRQLLSLPTASHPPIEKLKNFWLHKLYLTWRPPEAIPIEYLEKSELDPLLQLNKTQIVKLIDLLALNDLAEAIRHVVDKNTLTSIYACLNTQQQAFLRLCLHKKDKLAVAKLDLAKMAGSPNELRRTLHKRGMMRLGKALCGQSPEFMWHVTHVLDTGRGTSLLNYYQPQAIAQVTPLLIQQTMAAINFINET